MPLLETSAIKDIAGVLKELVTNFDSTQSFIAFIFIIFIIMFSKYIPKWIGSMGMALAKWIGIHKKPKAQNHDIFNTINEVLMISETIAIRGKSVKTKMFQNVVKTSTTLLRDYIETLVMDPTSYKISEPELSSKIDDLLNDVTRDFNTTIKTELKHKGLTQSDITFILSYISEDRLKTRDLVKKRCNKIFISDYYPTNSDKIVSFLEIMTYTIETSISSYKTSFELMNGRFDKYDWSEASQRYEVVS